MKDKLEVVRLVSAEEAIRLGDHRAIDDMSVAGEIMVEYRKKPSKSNDSQWDMLSLLAVVWNAGRVQGIREERKKRKELIANNRL